MKQRLLVFSDLDGTLLSYPEYDWFAAAPAIAALKARGVPLVLASSKTRREMEAWRWRLDNDAPFIAENGGALYVPEGTTSVPLDGAQRYLHYECVRLGAPYERLREVLPQLGRAIGVGLRGFGDLTRREIADITKLDDEDLDLALEREHDEPFVSERELSREEYERLKEEAQRHELQVVRGGLLYHLLGRNTKGDAARRLMAAFGGSAAVETMALGDGANDLEMLQAVARPVVIARRDGTHSAALRKGLPYARFTEKVGPAGFNQAVLDVLETIG